MSEIDDLCVAVLAAGQSTRFGEADKLAALLHGKMIGLHICETLAGFRFDRPVVVASDDNHPCEPEWLRTGFEVVTNRNARQGIGTSVAKAAQLAMARKARALLICLADMPFVPKVHIAEILTAFQTNEKGRTIASHDGKTASPPAIFGEELFPALAGLEGDTGARALLAKAIHVPADRRQLMDIDRPDILAKLNSGTN